jgi:hypothetical protein
MAVAAAHNRKGGLMATTSGVELPVAYLTLAADTAVRRSRGSRSHRAGSHPR